MHFSLGQGISLSVPEAMGSGPPVPARGRSTALCALLNAHPDTAAAAIATCRACIKASALASFLPKSCSELLGAHVWLADSANHSLIMFSVNSLPPAAHSRCNTHAGRD